MQIKNLHPFSYRARQVLSSNALSEKVIEQRRKVLGDWETLKRKGLQDSQIAGITGISRSTYYRRKQALRKLGYRGLEMRSRRPQRVRQSAIPKRVHKIILRIRKGSPTYGKSKIQIILKRDHGIELSCSSVGRILRALMNQGKIHRYRPSLKSRKNRRFQSHAKRWQYGQKSTKMGELVQIDHMSVNKNGCYVKHFQAWDPCSKMIVAKATTSATSNAAAQFLKKVIKDMPFKIKSIQVDGGSEFMKDFENLCRDMQIPLYVLPPKSPKYNGGVERGNRTFREDFYDSDRFIPGSIDEVREQLNHAVHKYNTYRPHQHFSGLTPAEYVNLSLEACQSHML